MNEKWGIIQGKWDSGEFELSKFLLYLALKLESEHCIWNEMYLEVQITESD